MRFDLGIVILIATLAFVGWAIGRVYGGPKRQHGMRIKLPVAERDEQERR